MRFILRHDDQSTVITFRTTKSDNKMLVTIDPNIGGESSVELQHYNIEEARELWDSYTKIGFYEREAVWERA